MSEHEQVGRHTPIDPTAPQVPDVADYGWPKQNERELRIKRKAAHTSIFYRDNPMKVVGWKGDLFPFKLNSRHPSDYVGPHPTRAPWVTFEASGVVVLSFLP